MEPKVHPADLLNPPETLAGWAGQALGSARAAVLPRRVSTRVGRFTQHVARGASHGGDMFRH